MTHAVCWITDYFGPECRARACVHSPSPFHPCLDGPDRRRTVALTGADMGPIQEGQAIA